jgi:hypothetical protein
MKQGTPRKHIAIIVLDKYLKEARDIIAVAFPGKTISNKNKDLLLNPAGI